MSKIIVTPGEVAKLRAHMFSALENNSLTSDDPGMKVSEFDRAKVLEALGWEEGRRLPTTVMEEVLQQALEKDEVIFLESSGRRKNVWVWVPRPSSASPVIQVETQTLPPTPSNLPTNPQQTLGATRLVSATGQPMISGDMRNAAAAKLLQAALQKEEAGELFSASEARVIVQQTYRRYLGFENWDFSQANGVLRDVLVVGGCKVRYLDPKEMGGQVPAGYEAYLFTLLKAGKYERGELPLPPLPSALAESETGVSAITPNVSETEDEPSADILPEVPGSPGNASVVMSTPVQIGFATNIGTALTIQVGQKTLPVLINAVEGKAVITVGNAAISAVTPFGSVSEFALTDLVLTIDIK